MTIIVITGMGNVELLELFFLSFENIIISHGQLSVAEPGKVLRSPMNHVPPLQVFINITKG